MIRAIIVDDEVPSLTKLKKLLEDSGLAKVSGAFSDPADALKFLQEFKADAVFLDIEMPDMDGIELASRILDLQGNISVVFVTAYNQYAVEAFRLNALDYLLKPVSPERLLETLFRIREEKERPLPSASLIVKCFGKFLVRAGTAEIHFRTEKAEEMLALLIDCQGEYVSRSKIIDNLWPDFDGDRAIVHFNTTLHYMKKALFPFGIQLSILYDRGSYRLSTEIMDSDYLKFCGFMDTHGTNVRGNVSTYEEIASLYTGEYLSGWDCEWAAGKRLLLEEHFLGLLLGLADYYKKSGNYQQAAKWLKIGLLHEPLHRELNYRLIEVLLLTHERIMATKYYKLYKNGLWKKFRTNPDPAFEDLLE